MKDQYVGDINDYFKYWLLRRFATIDARPQLLCWMKTPADARNDGRHIAYLSSPHFRGVDPDLFDALSEMVASGKRSIAEIEASGILGNSTFQSSVLEDGAVPRGEYFLELNTKITDGSLVFFDPDNGLEIPSVRRGRKNSAKYLYWDELACAAADNRITVTYQHFPRVNREIYVSRMLERCAEKLPSQHPLVIHNSRIAFLVTCGMENYATSLECLLQLSESWPTEMNVRCLGPVSPRLAPRLETAMRA